MFNGGGFFMNEKINGYFNENRHMKKRSILKFNGRLQENKVTLREENRN